MDGKQPGGNKLIWCKYIQTHICTHVGACTHLYIHVHKPRWSDFVYLRVRCPKHEHNFFPFMWYRAWGYTSITFCVQVHVIDSQTLLLGKVFKSLHSIEKFQLVELIHRWSILLIRIPSCPPWFWPRKVFCGPVFQNSA